MEVRRGSVEDSMEVRGGIHRGSVETSWRLMAASTVYICLVSVQPIRMIVVVCRP